MSDNDIPRLIDIRELKRITTLKQTAIYERIKAGEFRPIKLGRKTVFSANEVAAWVNNQIGTACDQQSVK